jgi:uncharacterized membrane protein
MRRLQWRVFFVITAMIGFMASMQDGSAQAITSDTVPSQILALVPAGAQVINQQYLKIQGDVAVSFIAERKSGLLSGTTTRFTFKLSSYDKNGYQWKMVAQGTRQDIETNSQRTAHSMSLTGDNPMISQPEVTPYPWGKGVTQKTRFYGEDRPDFYSYHCLYWGVVGTNVFSLEVEEIPDRADADKWAKSVADAVANISPSTLSK